jgi:hypothetical protein
MKKIEAYEANNRIFRTEDEARAYELGETLKELFAGRDARDILFAMTRRKEIRDHLVKIFRDYDHGEIESKAEIHLAHCKEIVENAAKRNSLDPQFMFPVTAINHLCNYFECIERSEEES